MTLSAARTMGHSRPKSFEREGLPVFEDDGYGWDDAPAEFATDVLARTHTLRFGPLAEDAARNYAALTAMAGYDTVLLRRDGDGWAEVERFPAASRLISLNAKPHSHWRR